MSQAKLAMHSDCKPSELGKSEGLMLTCLHLVLML